MEEGAWHRLASAGQLKRALSALTLLPSPGPSPLWRSSTETPAPVGKDSLPLPPAVLGSLGQDLLCSFMHQF